MIISDGVPGVVIPAADETAALEAYSNIPNSTKAENRGLYRPPSPYNFPSLDDYVAYLSTAEANAATQEAGDFDPEDEDSVNEVYGDVIAFNDQTDNNKAQRLSVFVRLFSSIDILLFAQLSLGIIAENYGDNMNPNVWNFAVQFETTVLDLLYSVVVDWQSNFDSRRFRHLEGEEFHRALASESIAEADVNTKMSIGCGDAGFCKAFVEFFEVGQVERALACQSSTIISNHAFFVSGCG